MTTPTTPASSLSVSQVSDEINPAGYVQGQQSVGANVVIRKLTGTIEKNRTQREELSLGGDLSNKTAFSEIIASALSNTQSGISTEDTPVTSVITLTANTDMFEPVVTWSYVINPDSVGVTSNDITISNNIVFDPITNRPASKSANVKLTSLSGNKTANLTVTGVITVPNYDSQGLFEIGTHTVNTCTKTIRLVVNAVNTDFQVTATPAFTVNATGTSAQTATVTLKASANSQLSNISYKFTPTFVSAGSTGPISPIIGPDSVIFTATTGNTPITNSATYSVLTEMFQGNTKIRSNTSTVQVRAQFIDREITSFTPTAPASNNQFSNSASQYSTFDVTAIHNAVAPTYTQGTITFTLSVTGDTVTQSTISSNTSSKTERISLYHNKDADGFGFKKAVVVVTATLRSPDNNIMDVQQLPPITLRAGTYGLTLNKPPSNTQVGFSAQTATSIGSASWGAGDFAWSIRQFNGSGPQVVQDNQPRTSTINIVASSPSGKGASQTISNTCNYDLTATLSFDGVTVYTTVLNDILIKAESQAYTYSVSTPATSNVQMEVNSVAEARMLVSATKSTGTITWTKDNASVGFHTTNATSATVETVSPAAGGANTQTVVVTGTLYDASSRVIEALSTPPITLDAATSKLSIIGENVTKTSNNKTDSVTGIYETTAVIGSHKFRFPPAKHGGNDLLVLLENPQRISITATATQSSNSGSYELLGEVNYKGVIRTLQKDVTVTINALAPSLTFTKTPYNYTTYSEIGSITGFGGEITGGIGSIAFFSYTGDDIVVETDYPGSINTNYTITRVVNILGTGENTALLSGPFYNQAANLPIVNPTTGLPTGYAGSINKRRDRVESTLLSFGFLTYSITYELRDTNNNVLITNTVSSNTAVIPPATGQVRLDFVSGTNAVLTVTTKPNNGYGRPEPNPLQVVSAQTINYSATYSSTADIPTPRFAFSFPNRPGDNVNATRVINANTINGQASVTVSSVYNDNGPTVTNGNGLNSIQVQLTSTDPVTGQIYFLGEPKALTDRYTVLMPPGRCYVLSTFLYGPRMYHTRDVFGNSNETVDYSRVPSSSSLDGPEIKFLGFHDGSTIYALSSRPLYSTNTKSATRYYSSTGHRSAHGNETPNVIIPTGYFMVMSFSETGTPSLGAITFVGSNGLTYPCGALWAKSLTTQNDTSRNNDAFDWFIFEPPVLPAGVTAEYVFISNGGYVPPPPSEDNISFTAVAPGNAYVGQNLNLNIGTVSGGLIEEDSFVDPGNIF